MSNAATALLSGGSFHIMSIIYLSALMCLRQSNKKLTIIQIASIIYVVEAPQIDGFSKFTINLLLRQLPSYLEISTNYFNECWEAVKFLEQITVIKMLIIWRLLAHLHEL